MVDHEDRSAAAVHEVYHSLEELVTQEGIDHMDDLVDQQDLGLLRPYQRKVEEGSLAGREVLDLLVRIEAQLVNQFGVETLDPEDAGMEIDPLLHRKILEQAELVGDEAYFLSPDPISVAHLPLIRENDTGQAFEECAFSRSLPLSR